jgi:hypothetical protein
VIASLEPVSLASAADLGLFLAGDLLGARRGLRAGIVLAEELVADGLQPGDPLVDILGFVLLWGRGRLEGRQDARRDLECAVSRAAEAPGDVMLGGM